MIDVILKPGREKSVNRKHPWLFSGGIQRVLGLPESGETVNVLDHRSDFLARGAFSPFSQIRVRNWSWDPNEIINEDFFYKKILASYVQRENIIQLFGSKNDNAFRMINGESDGLPGFIVDIYADILVVQCLSAGVEYWRDVLVDLLQKITGIKNVVERSDVDVRGLENLPERTGLLRGSLDDSLSVIQENNIKFYVEPLTGHKTGFYLDQKENRKIIRSISKNKSVLDCFSYTGGFTCSAAAGGADKIISVDTSEASLELARKNIKLNDLENVDIDYLNEDVFIQLRKFRDRGQTFDLIILDPPKFAHSTSQVERASRGYKDINLLAFKLLSPGGYLATFSCSGGVTEDLFQKIVAGAALDSGVNARIIKKLYQNYDHPVGLNFPEGAYLKGLLIQKE